MARGRPRKQGRRDKSGRLIAPKVWDRGNDKVAAMREQFGTDACDAIGRAYRTGLLGNDGQRLLQTGRSIHRAYWPMFSVGRVKCALGEGSSGGTVEGSVARERWLTTTIIRIDAMGRDHRRAFDEMVLDFNPDHGPLWLDEIIAQRGAPSHWSKLAKALEVLSELSGAGQSFAANPTSAIADAA